MSKKDVKKKNKKPWSKKTPLQKGAVISNWLSFALMISTFILLPLKIIGLFTFDWIFVWLPLIAGVVIGFLWFFFVLIMINVFHKK